MIFRFDICDDVLIADDGVMPVVFPYSAFSADGNCLVFDVPDFPFLKEVFDVSSI